MTIARMAGLLGMAAIAAMGTRAYAAVVYADTIVEYFDSGAGPLTGPYGGTYPGSFPVAVPLSYATDADGTTFVSLPTASYLTLGFSGGFVYDGPGLDLFVSEIGDNDETASIYVSSDFGATFTLLGVANTATVSGYDLASIGYTQNVNAVKIVGLDNFGGSPGFDLAYVQGLEGSSSPAPAPLPAAAWAGGGLMAVLGLVRHSRKRKGL